MILEHYDKTHIQCTDEQFYNLEMIFKIISEDGLQYVSSEDIIKAFYENDDVYYAGKYLFESYNSKDLMNRYCNLVRLIYSYHYKISDKINNELIAILYDIWIVE